MHVRIGLTKGACALLVAGSAWANAASAETASFQALQPGPSRFQIIGGSNQAKPAVDPPVAKPAPKGATSTPETMPKAAAAGSTVRVSPTPDIPGRTTEAALPAPVVSAIAAEPAATEMAQPVPGQPEAAAATIDPIVTAAIAPPRTASPRTVTPAVTSVDDNVKLVRPGNALLDEATRRARASLELFTRTANTPPEGADGFAVKVVLGPPNARESVWVSSLERRVSRRFLVLTSERWSGRLANEPTQDIGLKLGDRVGFSATDIRDWTYRAEDGRVVGNFTACALTAQEGPRKLADFVEKTRVDCSWIAEATRVAAR